ncbi:MAG TPA: contact-dependent growth inhibition system immunity protein [Flavisolibacter sp.]|jgi:hypothetical protein|nr:contact-dependent growth inhibition system immunity protein [Flavisolibacter sp.]
MRLKSDWRHKSLETLEQQDWGDPATAPTNLVKRCIELSKVPVETFTLGDLRLMIGQQFGLPYLIPIALEKLQDDIFVEADYYEGDLLSNILNVDTEFWRDNRNHWTQLNQLISDKRQDLAERKISTAKFDSLTSD